MDPSGSDPFVKSDGLRSPKQVTENRYLNYLRKSYRFEKITLFRFMNFRYHLAYNLRGAWHTLYAMLLSNYK